MIDLMLLIAACWPSADEADLARLRLALRPGASQLSAIEAAARLGPKARPLVLTLLSLLRTSRRAKVRGAVATALGRIGPKGDALADERSPLVAGLLRALEREDVVASGEKILLALRRTARPTPAVHAALARSFRLGRATVDFLVDCHQSTRLSVLEAGFSGDRPETAAVALELVIRLGPKARPLLPALILLTQDEDRVIRCNAARAILAANVPSLVSKADAVLAALVEGLDDNGMSYAPGINAPLDPHTVPLPRTTRALVAVLESRNYRVRFEAARALSHLPATASISTPALEKALKDEDYMVRLAAAASLVAIGQRAKGLPILRTLRSRSPFYLSWAHREGFTEEEAQKAYRHLRSRSPTDRILAASTLWLAARERKDGGRIHDPRQAAIETLGEVLANCDSSVSSSALATITRIGPSAARLWPRIARILRTTSETEILVEAVDALGSLGPRAARAEPELVRLLDHDSKELRLRAAVALNSIRPGHRHAVPTVLAVARRHPMYIGKACDALRKMGPHARRAVPWLERMLRSDACAQAAEALWGIDPKAARRAGAW